MDIKQAFQFLELLKENNNRDWFTENKPIYKEHESEMKDFFSQVADELSKNDNIESHRMMRIYRDVRFSKDKTPYSPRFGCGYKRATAALRGGYFIRLEPGNSVVGGGFYGPNKDDLKRIRQEFEVDDSEIRAIINDKAFVQTFGQLKGETLKTAPRGFDPNHPAIDLIRMKSFYVARPLTDEEVNSPALLELVLESFTNLRPFFDYMSSVLTTNTNGESII